LKVLIIEDHQIYANGLLEIVRRSYPDSVISVASNYNEVLSAINTHHFDLVFLDINLNGIDMFQKLTEIRSEFRAAKIIVLSSYFTPKLVKRAEAMNLNGYLVKNSGEDEILYAMNSVLDKNEFVVSGFKVDNGLDEYDTFQKVNELSKREKEIISLLAQGQNNSRIGDQLYISVNTVHTHRKNIYKKLNVNSVQELVSVAYRYGLI